MHGTIPRSRRHDVLVLIAVFFWQLNIQLSAIATQSRQHIIVLQVVEVYVRLC